MAYIDELQRIRNISFDQILSLAIANVPENKRRYPWMGLNHGTRPLVNEDELVQYLAAYGSMHREKLNEAFSSIKDPRMLTNRGLTIIDWGCGQALATICLFDYMRSIGITPQVEKIIIIEPSPVALRRAEAHLARYTNARVIAINKYIDEVEDGDIAPVRDTNVVHLFSNILDIDSVSLDRLSERLNRLDEHDQIIFCVSPRNRGAARIAEFANYMEIAENNLIAERDGQLAQRGTISMMVFRINATARELISVLYYPPRRSERGNSSALNNILAKIAPSRVEAQNTLKFHKAIVDLEKVVSSTVEQEYNYADTLNLATNRSFNINVCQNREFAEIYARNLREMWPKNLNVGINVTTDTGAWRLLECILTPEELRGLDITRELLCIDLAMFRVNRERADELGLTEDEIEAINEILADESITIDDLETILADAIYEDTSLARTLSLALTNDNLSLLHTAAELNNLQNAEYGEVMNALLGGNLENNSVCNIIADELIHITPIDDSQRAAIATALNSKLSVITGPPGTGKTQMIINLLSNALLRGKSVLVASKVNKAVDNVKDRFDALDPYHYMLRFGSRAVINGQLIPAVESIRAQIPERDYNIQHLSAILTEYQLVCQRAIEARGKLNELQALTKEIEELEHRIQELANNRNIRENTYNEALKTHRQNNADIAKIAENDTHNWEGRHVEVRTTLNLLYSKSKGLRRIIFNLFSKAKYSVKILYDALTLPDEIREKIEQESGIDSVARINSIDDLIRFTECEERHLSRIIAYRKRLKEIHSEHNNAIAEIDKAIKEANERLGWVRRRVAELQSQSEVLNTRIANAREQISGMSMELLRQRIKSRINAPNAISAIARYRGYIPENIPKRGPQIAQFIRDARDFINVFGLNCVTSLSVRNGYPLERELFDMVIIDEASQCDIASALPLIYRAKQVVVVGDPLQLEHITNVRREDEARIKEHLNINDAALVRNINWSLWDHCNAIISTAEENNKSIMLYHHYRCHPRIIGYSNEMFYNRRLGRPLDIHTTEDNGKPYPTGINWIDIEGVQDRYRNINEAEIVKALDIAIRIGRANPDVSIGIISPFRDQAEAIHSRIPEKLKGQIVADTVYRFQGDERDIIIYSTVVTNNSPESKIRWIDIACPNLVNVAVTRAKSSLFIVGNRRYIDEHSNHNRPLGYLSEYTQQNEQH